MKVTVGKAEDPWCEIELTEEDVEETWRPRVGQAGLYHVKNGCLTKKHAV